jgi:hypothetical protein
VVVGLALAVGLFVAAGVDVVGPGAGEAEDGAGVPTVAAGGGLTSR